MSRQNEQHPVTGPTTPEEAEGLLFDAARLNKLELGKWGTTMVKEYCAKHKEIELRWRKDKHGKFCRVCVGNAVRSGNSRKRVS